MKDKPVTDLAGIGEVLGARLKKEGYDKAYVVLGQFFLLKQNQADFEDWLRDITHANKKQSGDCYQCLKCWCDAFFN